MLTKARRHVFKSPLILAGIAASAIALDSQSAFARTVAVGPASCQPTYTHYATIQAAVDALASVSQTNTILVCPGTYPEQITIAQPSLTIKGVVNGNEGLAVITVPINGLVPNVVTSLGPVAAQIGSTAALGVKLVNLTIDGTGGTCDGGNRVAGIAFANIGDASSSTYAGTIQQVVVRNQTGCAGSDGILSDASYISITGSIIHDIAENCIHQIGGDNNINNNTLQICYKAGIWLDGTRDAMVQNNVLFNATWGIKLDRTTDVTLNANTVGPWIGTAIYVLDSVNTGVTSNKVKEAYYGIWLGASTGAIVRLNNIQRAFKAAMADVNSLGNNQFTSNTISETQYGFYIRNFEMAIPDILEPNTYLNTQYVTTNELTFP